MVKQTYAYVTVTYATVAWPRQHRRAMSLARLRDHFGVSRDTMAAWLSEEPTPEWARRPTAKDDLRAEAVVLRREGRTVPQIAERLGVANESADVDAAGRWWAAAVGVPFGIFRRPTLKTHNPSTVRRNVGDPYRGCLIVGVPKSRRLYWRIEGLMGGIAAAKDSTQEVRM